LKIDLLLKIYVQCRQDPRGRVLKFCHENDPLLDNFLVCLRHHFKGGGVDETFKNVSGSNIIPLASLESLWNFGPTNDSTQGIVVGRGNTAVTLADYKLQTQCTQGSGSNQLLHSSHTWNPLTRGAPYSEFAWSRFFTNASPADITITEAGLYSRMEGVGPTFERVCVARDVFTGVLVPVLANLFVDYTVRITL